MTLTAELPRTYPDLRDHIEALDRAGLLYRMTPYVDVQFVRGFHAPPFRYIPAIDNSIVLIDATLREDDWWDELDDEAQLAVEGPWAETGTELAGRRKDITGMENVSHAG